MPLGEVKQVALVKIGERAVASRHIGAATAED
jgi:hypothetical protein